MSGGINQRQTILTPRHAGRGGLNRNAALLFLDHEVHRRGAIVHLADLVVFTRIIQNTLGRRRFAAVDVSHNAEVAHSFEWYVTFSHFSP